MVVLKCGNIILLKHKDCIYYQNHLVLKLATALFNFLLRQCLLRMIDCLIMGKLVQLIRFVEYKINFEAECDVYIFST